MPTYNYEVEDDGFITVDAFTNRTVKLGGNPWPVPDMPAGKYRSLQLEDIQRLEHLSELISASETTLAQVNPNELGDSDPSEHLCDAIAAVEDALSAAREVYERVSNGEVA